jgi:hypothetical protein
LPTIGRPPGRGKRYSQPEYKKTSAAISPLRSATEVRYSKSYPLGMVTGSEINNNSEKTPQN